MTPRTKDEYKLDIKKKLSAMVAAQWAPILEDYERAPHLYTDEEAAELVKCSDAVRELRAELEGAQTYPPICDGCGEPVLPYIGCLCKETSL